MKTLSPNDSGKLCLVEDCQKITITEFLKEYQDQLKQLMLKSRLDVLDIRIQLSISKTVHNGIRYWFGCPHCHKRVGVLYIHPTTQRLGCRGCLNLTYRSRRYKGMLEETLFKHQKKAKRY